MTPALLAAALTLPAAGRDAPPPRPDPGDQSADALATYETRLARFHGGDRTVPLAVKADHYQWAVERYFLETFEDGDRRAPGLVQHAVFLPKGTRGTVNFSPGADTVTWNGALLAATSYRWAVTGDPAALDFARTLLRGLEFAVEVTGEPGLPCRCVTQADEPVGNLVWRYRREGMRPVRFRSDAAKGTVNQVAQGLAVFQLLCADALEDHDRKRAGNLSLALADHLARHDYRLTRSRRQRDGVRQPHPADRAAVDPVQRAGGLPDGRRRGRVRPPPTPTPRPSSGSGGSSGTYGRNTTSTMRAAAGRSNRSGWGTTPLVKGMNDRHHVLTAGYVSLLMEWELARRANAAADGRFLYEMGRTPVWAARGVRGERNALLEFLYAGLLTNGRRAAAMLPEERERAEEFAAAPRRRRGRGGAPAAVPGQPAALRLRRRPGGRRHLGRRTTPVGLLRLESRPEPPAPEDRRLHEPLGLRHRLPARLLGGEVLATADRGVGCEPEAQASAVRHTNKRRTPGACAPGSPRNPHQLALVIPGIRPSRAMSRSMMREIWNLR